MATLDIAGFLLLRHASLCLKSKRKVEVNVEMAYHERKDKLVWAIIGEFFKKNSMIVENCGERRFLP